MNIFLDRKNIEMINVIRNAWGLARSAQSNSPNNGRFGVVRLYDKPEYKGHPDRAVVTLHNEKELRQYFNEHHA